MKKIILYDNVNVNYDEDWFDAYKEHCESNEIDCSNHTIDSQEFFDFVNDTMQLYMEDFLVNLKHIKEDTDCVVLGSIGLWNGTVEIEPHKFGTLYDAVMACLRNADYCIIKDNNGVIEISIPHHDGNNYFTIHKLNKKGLEIQDRLKLDKECYFKKFNIYF